MCGTLGNCRTDVCHTGTTIEIRGKNADKTFSKTSEGCRGIVLKDSQLLISHEVHTDFYMLPGGGMDAGETPEACCVREVCEETGYIVKPVSHFLTVNEYYRECRYVCYYFICDIMGQSKQKLTAKERQRGLTPEWISIEKMMELYSKYDDFAATNEDRRNAYLRDYTVLREFLRRNG